MQGSPRWRRTGCGETGGCPWPARRKTLRRGGRSGAQSTPGSSSSPTPASLRSCLRISCDSSSLPRSRVMRSTRLSMPMRRRPGTSFSFRSRKPAYFFASFWLQKSSRRSRASNSCWCALKASCRAHSGGSLSSALPRCWRSSAETSTAAPPSPGAADGSPPPGSEGATHTERKRENSSGCSWSMAASSAGSMPPATSTEAHPAGLPFSTPSQTFGDSPCGPSPQKSATANPFASAQRSRGGLVAAPTPPSARAASQTPRGAPAEGTTTSSLAEFLAKSRLTSASGGSAPGGAPAMPRRAPHSSRAAASAPGAGA
mmetsp:Transcript_97202/g.253289  ORF Transcript_97202/g.253289 Transcript_97202/m.253289 type:complete len:315 (+) Transcript_97202:49-993(+)